MANWNAMTGPKPLGDLAYDLVTILHEKAKGLEAIDEYLEDAKHDEEVRKLFERIRKQDEQQIEEIKRVALRCLESEEESTHPRRSGAV
jgi:hypothetical protein